MERRLSIYLDLLRLSAAIVVFLDHFSIGSISGGLFWQAQPYGHSAVIVFFVLSGFVISFTSEAKEHDLKSYVIARLARLWSVVLPAIALTALCDTIGMRFSPALYAGISNCHADAPVLRLLLGVTFMGQVWTVDLPPSSNPPFWSLPYEFWYYAIFAAATYFNGWHKIAGVSLAALIAGPKILLLLPVWLLGVMCWRYRQVVSACTGRILFIGSIVGIATLEMTGRDILFPIWHGVLLPPLFSLHDYVLGALVAAHILGAARVGPALPCAGIIRKASGYTFSLYLYHFPLLLAVRSMIGGDAAAESSRAVVCICTLAGTLALGTVTEAKKHVLRRALSNLLTKAASSVRAAAA